MESYLLRQNVLSDNTLLIADEGKVFKGGYKAIIKEYSFQSAWTDKENITKFRKMQPLIKYLQKHYEESEIQDIKIEISN
jgi:hypothetical protein